MEVKSRPEPQLEPARQLNQFVYMNGGGGIGYTGLDTFNTNKLALPETAGTGPVVDAGAGFRGENFSLGPRLRMAALSPYNVWQINGEMTVHAPVGEIDGYLGVHAGYVFLDGFNAQTVPDAAHLQVTGFDAGLHAGWDYYPSPEISLGVDFGGEVLFINRPAFASRHLAYRVEGKSTGIAGNVSAHLGLHF